MIEVTMVMITVEINKTEGADRSINQHVIFSINRLINTVTNDNMEWTKPKPKYRHKILIKQSI